MPSSSMTFVLLSSAFECASQYTSLLIVQTYIHADLDEDSIHCCAMRLYAVSSDRGNQMRDTPLPASICRTGCRPARSRSCRTQTRSPGRHAACVRPAVMSTVDGLSRGFQLSQKAHAQVGVKMVKQVYRRAAPDQVFGLITLQRVQHTRDDKRLASQAVRVATRCCLQ